MTTTTTADKIYKLLKKHPRWLLRFLHRILIFIRESSLDEEADPTVQAFDAVLEFMENPKTNTRVQIEERKWNDHLAKQTDLLGPKMRTTTTSSTLTDEKSFWDLVTEEDRCEVGFVGLHIDETVEQAMDGVRMLNDSILIAVVNHQIKETRTHSGSVEEARKKEPDEVEHLIVIYPYPPPPG